MADTNDNELGATMYYHKNEIVSGYTREICNHRPQEISDICVLYYYDLEFIFDKTLQLFLDSKSSKQLDGNKYFANIFLECAQSCNQLRHHMINAEFISILGNYYFLQEMPDHKPYELYYVDWKYHKSNPQPDLDIIAQIIITLLISCHTPATTKILNWYQKKKHLMNDSVKEQWLKLPSVALSYKNPDDEHPKYLLHSLSENDQKIPHCRFTYSRLIYQSYTNKKTLDALIKLILHWSFEDKTYSNEVTRMIIEGIDKSGSDKVDIYLSLMRDFISIKDEIQNERIKQLHSPNLQGYNIDKGVLEIIHVYRVDHVGFTFKCIKAIILMMRDNEIYSKYMMNRRQDWQWFDEWMQQYCNDEGNKFFDETYVALISSLYKTN